MGALLRATDWSQTKVGPVESWPQSLRTAVSIVLSSRFGMYIAWGKDYTQFYNDAYRPILGASKHPAAGKPGSQTFAESWHIIGPLFDGVMRGEAVGSEDWMLPLDRNGYLEECFFTFCYSPIRDETGEPGGVLVTVTETTGRAVGERRAQTLRRVAAGAAEAQTREEAFGAAAGALAQDPADLPFVLLYSLDGDTAQRQAAVHLEPGSPAAPLSLALGAEGSWPLAQAAASGSPVLVADVAARFGALRGPAWPEPVGAALVVPLTRSDRPRPFGFAVLGISPRRALDDAYRGFLSLAVDPLTTALAAAQAREQARVAEQAERERLEALFVQSPVAVAVLRGPSHRYELANRLYDELSGNRPLIGRTVREAFPELERQGIYPLLDRVYQTGEPFVGKEVPLQLHRDGEEQDAWLDFTYQPLRDAAGQVTGVMVVAVDVTAQVTARQLLRSSEERYRSLVDAGRQVIWTNTAEGEMRGEQPGWARLTGQSYAQYQGYGWAEAVHPDDRGPTIEAWRRAVDTRSVFDFEHRVRSPSGDFRPYSIRAVPLLEADGRIREWVGVHTDLTGQRKAEAEAQLERARLRTVFDAAPVAIAVTRGPEHRYESSNRRFAELSGREVVGKTAREAFPELDNEELFALLDGVYRSGQPFVGREFPASIARGGAIEEGFYDFIYQPLTDASGATTGLMTLAYEVTAQVRARQALERVAADLRSSEERFRLLNETIPQQVWTGRPDGQLDFVNRRVLDYFGRTSEEMIGNGWQGLVHPDDLPRTLERWTRSLTTGEPYENEFRLRRAADGAFRWNLAQAVCSRDDQGRIERWFGSNTDIHDRKENEKLRESLIQALERSNADLDQFAYVASHDLKAPLRGIANLSEWLEEDLGPALNQPARDKLVKLRGRVHRMEALIDGILDYSRAGRVRHKPERVEVSRLLGEVTDLLAPRPGVRVEVAAAMPVLHTEKVPLQQVFLNLVGNALKHARRDDARVEVRVADQAGFFRFTVADNGQGIAPEFHDRIWGIFQTLEARDKVEGAGIGLSVVRKIVESRGGAAWVESSAGAGAAFHFTWPRWEAPAN